MSSGRSQVDKNMKSYNAVILKSGGGRLPRGGRLKEVQNIALTGKFWGFSIGGRYMRGDRTWRFACIILS